MLDEAYFKVAMKKTQWHKHFGDGCASVNDDPCCWQPSTSTNDNNIERVCSMLCGD
jgi:hypothetical protein